jgi:signal transduction histidine kinase
MRRILIAVTCFLLLCRLPAAAAAAPVPAHNVLLLHSYHDGYGWTDALTDGIRARLEEERLPFELFVEYLDTQRQSDSDGSGRMADLLAAKYAPHPLSAVIAADDAAVEFMLRRGGSLFPRVPVVFCGLNDRKLAAQLPRERFTGVLEQFSAERIFTLATRLSPATRRVFVINENTLTGVSLKETHTALAAKWPSLQFVFLDGSTLTFDEILARLREASPDDLVFTTQFHLDHAGTFIPGDEGVRRIVETSRAPVLSSVVSDVSVGVLVGSENAGLLHGRQAADLATRILRGASPASIPVRQDQTARLLVNAAALEARRLDGRNLPPWATLVNVQPSFVREHPALVAGTLAFIALQMLAIGALVANVRRRRRAEGRLAAQARELAASNASFERANASLVAEQQERQRAEERLRHAQKMDAVGRLAGGVAHDFNNLLTVIRGYSDLVLADTAPDDPVHASVDEIRKASERAASLTHQLLAFSRKQVLQPRVLDLNAVVADTEKMLKRLIGEDIALATALADRLPAVLVDEGEWQQIIVNLAVNARDAMPAGGTLTVRTREVKLEGDDLRAMPQMPAGRYVLLEVSDNGVGMDPDVQARIFEPFFTTKERGKGVGLGLSTVYGIVKQSGGWIYVQSAPGAGTTFRIYLPPTTQAPQAAPPPPALPSAVAHETVLLVEDQEDVRTLAATVLRARGYTVVEASGGEEALARAAAASGPIHLVVTDVVMPGMRGPEVVQRLQARYPAMRALYISGYTDDLAHGHGPGLSSGLLEKPFTPQALIARVREALDEGAAPAS